MTEKIVSLAAKKKKREKEAYKALVLATFDRFEHEDRREELQHRAEVESAARERL